MTHTNENDTPQTAYRWLFTATVTASSLIALLTYVILAYPNRDPRMSVHDMLAFTAYRPFVTRVLLPMLAGPLSDLLPAAWVEYGAANPALGRAMSALDMDHPAQALAVLLVMAAFLLAWVVGLRRLMQALSVNSLSCDLLTLAAPWTLLAFTLHPQIYDLATLATFTWCLVFLARGQDDHFLVAFMLACLARETAILLIPLHWVIRRQPGDVVEQIGLYAVSRSVLLLLLAGNPGANVEYHLTDFLSYARHPHAIPSTAAALAFVAVILWRWKDKPLLLRQAFLIFAPPLLLLHLVVGYPFEVRMFLEVLPVAMLLLLNPRAYDRSQYPCAGLPAGHAAADLAGRGG